MAKQKKEVREFEIDSFRTLCNIINRENFQSLTTDLLLWLGYHVEMMDVLRKADPKGTAGKTNWELGKSTFIWIDDGKNDLMEVRIKNTDTGEVHHLKVTPKK